MEAPYSRLAASVPLGRAQVWWKANAMFTQPASQITRSGVPREREPRRRCRSERARWAAAAAVKKRSAVM